MADTPATFPVFFVPKTVWDGCDQQDCIARCKDMGFSIIVDLEPGLESVPDHEIQSHIEGEIIFRKRRDE